MDKIVGNSNFISQGRIPIRFSLETVLLENIHPNPGNEAKFGSMSNDEIKMLQQSITEIGLINPIIINRNTRQIIAGHQRYNALKALGYREIEVIVRDITEPSQEEKIAVCENILRRIVPLHKIMSFTNLGTVDKQDIPETTKQTYDVLPEVELCMQKDEFRQYVQENNIIFKDREPETQKQMVGMIQKIISLRIQQEQQESIISSSVEDENNNIDNSDEDIRLLSVEAENKKLQDEIDRMSEELLSVRRNYEMIQRQKEQINMQLQSYEEKIKEIKNLSDEEKEKSQIEIHSLKDKLTVLNEQLTMAEKDSQRLKISLDVAEKQKKPMNAEDFALLKYTSSAMEMVKILVTRINMCKMVSTQALKAGRKICLNRPDVENWLCQIQIAMTNLDELQSHFRMLLPESTHAVNEKKIEQTEKFMLFNQYIEARSIVKDILLQNGYVDRRLNSNETLYEVFYGYVQQIKQNNPEIYDVIAKDWELYSKLRFDVVAAWRPFLQKYLAQKGLSNIDHNDLIEYEIGLEQALDRMDFPNEQYIHQWLDSRYHRYMASIYKNVNVGDEVLAQMSDEVFTDTIDDVTLDTTQVVQYFDLAYELISKSPESYGGNALKVMEMLRDAAHTGKRMSISSPEIKNELPVIRFLMFSVGMTYDYIDKILT